MGYDQTTMHHTRAELQGTVEYFYSDGAISAADAILRGYLNYGNFLGVEFKADPKRQPRKSAARGVIFEAGSTGAEITIGLELTTNEVADPRKQRLAHMAADGAPFTQAAINAAAADQLAFTADVPAKLNYDYPLTKNGVLLRHVSAATLQVGANPALQEGVDYLLDKELAQVRFINAGALPAAAVTVTVTAPAIDATHDKYMIGITPAAQPVRRGYARLLVWDTDAKNRLVKEYEPRPVEMYNSGGYSVTGDKQSEFKIAVMFTSIVERLLVRP